MGLALYNQTIMKIIKLTRGQVALVDDADFEDLARFKWYAHWRPLCNSFYATRGIWLLPGPRRGIETMHRRVMGLEGGDKRRVAHKTPNTLDNRRANLLFSHSELGTGICRSHCAYRQKKPFVAQAPPSTGKKFLGRFATIEETREARRKWLEARRRLVADSPLFMKVEVSP